MQSENYHHTAKSYFSSGRRTRGLDMRELLAGTRGMHAGISALVVFAKSSRSANASANAIDVSSSDTNSEGKSGESNSNHESAEEELMKKSMVAITTDAYFDITSLHEGYLEVLRFRFSTGVKPKSTLLSSGISLVSSEFREKDFSKVIDWNFFQSGFLNWIKIMASVPEKCSQIADRIEWYQGLLKVKNVSDSAKALYARKFTRKYARKSGWNIYS